jgi:hypothetical protein
VVKSALATLPALITAAREKDMGDMMGKLKEVSLPFFIAVGFLQVLIDWGNEARQWHLEAIWPLHRQFQDDQGRGDRGLQHAVQSKPVNEWDVSRAQRMSIYNTLPNNICNQGVSKRLHYLLFYYSCRRTYSE